MNYFDVPVEDSVAAEQVATQYPMLEMFGKMSISLAIIITLILVMAHVAKRLQERTRGGNKETDLQVLQTVHLGTKQKLTVVSFEGQKILLGVTPNSITPLTSQSAFSRVMNSKAAHETDSE